MTAIPRAKYDAETLTAILEDNVRAPLLRLVPEATGKPIEYVVARVVERFGCPTCKCRKDVMPCNEEGTIFACNDKFHVTSISAS